MAQRARGQKRQEHVGMFMRLYDYNLTIRGKTGGRPALNTILNFPYF